MQKFIIIITKADFDLLTHAELECFILSANLPADFINKFTARARTENKIILTQTAEDCLKFGLDGVLLDLSKSENLAADFKKETSGSGFPVPEADLIAQIIFSDAVGALHAGVRESGNIFNNTHN